MHSPVRNVWIRGGHRHLQIGRMLDIDLIPDLRSKGVKGLTFWKTEIKEIKIVPSTSIFAQVEDRTVIPSTINVFFLGGGGTQKTTSGSHYLYLWTVDQDAETLKYHSETGPTSQPDTRCQPLPPPPLKGQGWCQSPLPPAPPPPRNMYPKCGNLCGQKGHEAIPS